MLPESLRRLETPAAGLAIAGIMALAAARVSAATARMAASVGGDRAAWARATADLERAQKIQNVVSWAALGAGILLLLGEG